MNATEAIRYLAHEAADCRGRGAADAFCLILPPIVAQLGLPPMTDAEARDFARELCEALKNDLRRAA